VPLVTALTDRPFLSSSSDNPPGWVKPERCLLQPLRVEHDRASLTLPVARTKSGQVVHTSVDTRLAPEARQTDLAVTWEQALAGRPLRPGFIWSRNPDHHASADPHIAFLAGWRRTF